MAINLSQRDKKAVIVLIIALGLFLLARLIVFPMLDHRKSLARKIAITEQRLSEMLSMQRKYETIKFGTSTSENTHFFAGKNFSLFSLMEQVAGRSGIKSNIAYMKPSTSEKQNDDYRVSIVEMKLEAVTTKQLLKFLYQLETYQTQITIARMTVSKTGDTDGFIDVVIQTEAYTQVR
jgi:general secretion pathway protein M